MWNAHCRTWSMAIKLKITENEKHTVLHMKYSERHGKNENEKCPREELEYGEKTENHGKQKIHTVGPGLWLGN